MLNTELRINLIEFFKTTKNGTTKNGVQIKNENQNEITFINPHKPLDEFTIRQIKYEIEVIVPLTKFQYKKIFTNNKEIIEYLNLHLEN
jgi:hypothetical protein